MKILMTADTVGGVFSYAMDLLASLGADGHQLCLVTMGPTPMADQREAIKASRVQEHHHIEGRLEWMQDPWNDLEHCGRELQKIVQRTTPDLLHFNHFAHAAMEWPCPVVVVAHSCVATWYRAVHGTQPEHLLPYYELVRENLRAADAVVAPSNSMLAEFSRLYGPFRRGSTIYNGMRKLPVRATQRDPVIFSMGRLWDEAKNINTLINAAPLIEAEIHIAGECPPGLRLPQNVICLGRLPRKEILERIGRAMVYALPVKYEPFGLSFLEAALSGCALIGGDIPTLREIWGESMVHVRPNDTEALAAACNALIVCEALREEMSDRARARASRYDPMIQRSHYLSLYEALLSDQHKVAYTIPSRA